MKFGTGSSTELTQKYKRVKVQMTYEFPHIYIDKLWLCGVVVMSLAQGPEVPSSSPTQAIFLHLSPTSPTSPPSCDWVPGIFLGANSRPFLISSNGPGGTSGAHTICCEERPVLLRVPSPAPGALLARLTVPA